MKNSLEYNEDGTLKTPVFNLMMTEDELNELDNILGYTNIVVREKSRKWQNKLKSLVQVKEIF